MQEIYLLWYFPFRFFHNFFSKDNENSLGNFEDENPEALTVDELRALKAKGYAYKGKVKE